MSNPLFPPPLPHDLVGVTDERLAERYFHLSIIKGKAESRVGRHPSDRNIPSEIEQDPGVREVIDRGLIAIVWEMAAIHTELHSDSRPQGFMALHPGMKEMAARMDATKDAR